MMIEKAQFEDLAEILSLQKLAYQSEAAICNDYTIPPLVQKPSVNVIKALKSSPTIQELERNLPAEI
jgi:hypothetical protein